MNRKLVPLAQSVQEFPSSGRHFRLKKTPLLLASFFMVVCLTGCVTSRNGFSQFYQQRAGAEITNLPPHSGSTQVRATSNIAADTKNLFREGYTLIGESAFEGPSQPESSLISQAKKVEADLVLLSCVYLGSEQSTVPIVQYNPGQTYTTTSSGTMNASAFGSGGYAYGTGSYNGVSTTTSPGTFSTQMIPVTVHRYQYDAAFFRKMPPPILGAVCQPLPAEVRQTLQRNTGVLVWAVRNDSPAYVANILEGDVIIKINEEEVLSLPDYVAKYTKVAGRNTDIEVWRNGQLKTISVKLNDRQ